MPAPDRVYRLVEQFDHNKDALKSRDYNEAEVRVQFINPLFKALGWDVYNEQGLPPGAAEVVSMLAARSPQ